MLFLINLKAKLKKKSFRFSIRIDKLYNLSKIQLINLFLLFRSNNSPISFLIINFSLGNNSNHNKWDFKCFQSSSNNRKMIKNSFPLGNNKDINRVVFQIHLQFNSKIIKMFFFLFFRIYLVSNVSLIII